jgi:hypothetical protein
MTAKNNEAFFMAATNGHVHVVRRLLGERADPSTNVDAAFRFAAKKGYFDVIRLLMKDDRVDPCAGNDIVFKEALARGLVDVVENSMGKIGYPDHMYLALRNGD